jgi:1,4-dihydroxy-2-naphthoate octaprenyltransferase
MKNAVKIWSQQIRAPFLILPLVLVFLGFAAAHRDGFIHWGHGLLLLLGVVLAHISVNLFNELSDYRTKIDAYTTRTPFSGGSGMMQAGCTSPASVAWVAYSTLAVAAVIGVYFCFVSGWFILIFMIAGALAIRYYTSHFARWLVGEFIAGLALGSFVVLGVYYALAGRLTLAVAWISIPPGILTTLLLFLNEFPDVEADEKGGRRHLVIAFGRRRSARIYVACLVVMYTVILASPFIRGIPTMVLLGMITLPLAVKASILVLRHYDDTQRLIPALGMNVGIVILTDLFLGIGYLL